MSPQDLSYLQEVTRHQAAIYGYLRTIAPGAPLEDVLQEVNVTLWQKAEDFEPGTNFKAYAFRIAHFKALEALRAAKRKAWLVFDSDVIERVTSRQIETDDTADRQGALRGCLEELDEDERGRLHRRYTMGETVREIARSEDRAEAALQQWFFRIRGKLRACIERQLALEGGDA